MERMTRINITASYKNNKKIFICYPEELLKQIEEYFSIDLKNMDVLFVDKKKRQKIDFSDIRDLMAIEIVEKNSIVMNGSRNLRSSSTIPPNELLSYADSIKRKLRENTILSGSERKALIEFLDSYPSNVLGKRKHSDTNLNKETHCKKVQVNMHATNTKDSFTQTDALVSTAINSKHPEESEHVSQKMKKLFYSGNLSEEETAKLMDVSFEERRNFIVMRHPSVVLVQDKYPSLFSLTEVKNELGRVLYPGICEEFLKNMAIYSDHILDLCDQNDELYRRIVKSVEHAATDTQKSYARIVGSVLIVSKILKEPFSFIHLADNPHSSDSSYPYIDASCHHLKEVFFDNLLFPINVEGKTLCEANNFLEAVLCLMAAFFIFNIEYTENCCQTLIVFEKLYLRANDTTDMNECTAQLIKTLKIKVPPNERKA